MQRIFLLRAYGDFVIALQAIAKSDKKIHIVASDHLAQLYYALLATSAIPPLSIEFIALGVQHGQLNFFTNKHLLSIDTIKQLRLLKIYLKINPNPTGTDYIEHEIRLTPLNFLLGHPFKSVVPFHAKVYAAFDLWLDLPSSIQIEEVRKRKEASNKSITVMIFPDARLKKKEISNLTIAQLRKLDKHQNPVFKIARFNNINKLELSYSNFETLINFIKVSDYIYTSDSLPAHIAQVLAIPHSIIYSYNGVNRFCTPYALHHQSYFEKHGS